ncbi:MAG: hypothetical protein ACK53T_05575 [Planctomycetota bacterium]|jgi:hypothetical protein
MIHYHGVPVTPTLAASRFLARRHACVSMAHPSQLPLVAEVCQSFILDNGAFSRWRAGDGRVDPVAFAEWVAPWMRHPAFDWCLIPDVIDGTEQDNDVMIAAFSDAASAVGLSWSLCVPVWHMHESLDRLRYLSIAYQRVALGSSGDYATVGTDEWWHRMGEAMAVICDDDGRPRTKLHGLRMLNPTVFSQLPLASADSTNVARNMGIDKAWRGPYAPLTPETRAAVLAERIETHASAARWSQRIGTQINLELVG